MSETIDISNQWLVGRIESVDRIVIANPPRDAVMPPMDVLVLAAWLVRVAQPLCNVSFDVIRSAVANNSVIDAGPTVQ